MKDKHFVHDGGGQRSTSYTHPSPLKATDTYAAINKGTGSVLQAQKLNSSLGFDVTMRNTQTNYHSNGVGMKQFNNQNFTALKNDSRFRSTFNSTADDAMTPKSPDYSKGEMGKSLM
jgi:hypothetical protein